MDTRAGSPDACHYAGGPACARCASTRRSSRRELIPSLVNTLPRCHSTVRALRNSWAPISVLVWPSRASRAMDASCAVSSVRVCAARLCARLAGGQQFAPGALGERRGTHRGQYLVRGPELRAGVCAAALAAQPFAVEQMGAGEFRAEPGTAQPVDCLAVKAVGGFTVAQQRARACLEAKAVVRAAGLGGFRQPFQRILAVRVSPLRTAASISSGSAHMET